MNMLKRIPCSLVRRRPGRSYRHFSTGDELISQLPPQFLRMSCDDCFDPKTHQRSDVKVDINDGRPIQQAIEGKIFDIREIVFDSSSNSYIVHFQDGHENTFSKDWVEMQISRMQGMKDLTSLSPIISRTPWTNLQDIDLRRPYSNDCEENMEGIEGMAFSFHDLVLSENHEHNVDKALELLHRYGILLVSSTPVDDNGAAIAALSSVFSGAAFKTSPDTSPLAHYRHGIEQGIKPNSVPCLGDAADGPYRTLFGGVWSTHSSQMTEGTSTADSAYGNDALPLHTDMTYYRDPPGLQIFTMVSPADQGGESIFTDGLAVGERMRKEYPKEFEILCSTSRRYRSIDDKTGWHLEACGPIFQTSSLNARNNFGPILSIRHNDLDRLPDLPVVILKNYDTFYKDLIDSHKVLDKLLSSDEFRLVIGLQAGETVVVSNQRCLHGRQSFLATSSPRIVMGSYVSQDDLDSRMRWMMNGLCTFQ
ncbi:trimethyllysine dioxygenase [Chaetoceros tenuissimus]|uniref:Trimethyllysine dioxygenase n=1 Tax=Chaetoceros tenuissimus TaxID=426638 RepID=A0AAD3CXA6_9STRA|nr:trimethyllysine dioxygenase [Chaetoceros tenuissimus]